MSTFSNYDFVNAKLRARMGIMRDSSLFDEMIKSPSLTEAFAKLEGTYHSDLLEVYRNTGDLEQVELRMLEDEIALYREVEGYLPAVPAAFISVLLEKIEVDNIKNVIRLWYSDVIRHHIISYRSAYLYKKTIVHSIDYDKAVNARPAACFDKIADSPCSHGMLAVKGIRAVYGAFGDFFGVDVTVGVGDEKSVYHYAVTTLSAFWSPSFLTASSRILYLSIFPATFIGKLSTKSM